jgi:F-type H+-transporting ATPase subunit a
MINKINTFRAFLAFLLALFTITNSAFANEHSDSNANPHAQEEKFEPTKVIFEHISDSHDWHMWGEHEHAVSIPLPVIIYSDKGLDIFLSSAFHHGTQPFKGKYTYILEENHIKVIDETGAIDETASSKILDFSITKNVASMFVSVAIILGLFLSMAGAYKKNGIAAPKGKQSFLEPLVMFVRDEIARPNIGAKADKFLPFLLTVFFFIWINNLLGLLPIGANLTGNISVTLTLALVTLVVVNINGNGSYWKHILLPPVPWWLYPIMIPVELIGVFSKPFALMVRLFANITAGHIVVISLISLIFIFKSVAIAPVSIAFALFIDVLELLVAFLQAFIFTMLTALFIGSATEEHHHDEAHAEGGAHAEHH